MKINGYNIKGIKRLSGVSKRLPKFPFKSTNVFYPYLVKTDKNEYTLYATLNGYPASNDVVQIETFNRPVRMQWLYTKIKNALKAKEPEEYYK